MTDAPTSETSSGTLDAEGFSVFVCSKSERAALDLWADLLRVTGSVRGLLAPRLAVALGLLPEEVDLLMRLDEAPERRLRMADVSRSLQLSKSGVTRLVDRLEERGLVERAPCPSDRRVVYAGLTNEGRRAATEAAPLLIAGVVENLSRYLAETELDGIRQSLRTIIASQNPA
jgi:DNA-binding MarR family transcriptional regulator